MQSLLGDSMTSPLRSGCVWGLRAGHHRRPTISAEWPARIYWSRAFARIVERRRYRALRTGLRAALGFDTQVPRGGSVGHIPLRGVPPPRPCSTANGFRSRVGRAPRVLARRGRETRDFQEADSLQISKRAKRALVFWREFVTGPVRNRFRFTDTGSAIRLENTPEFIPFIRVICDDVLLFPRIL